MSTDEKTAFELVTEALHALAAELHSGFALLRNDLSGLRVALVEFHDDQTSRHERLEALLVQHSSRLSKLERTVEALPCAHEPRNPPCP